MKFVRFVKITSLQMQRSHSTTVCIKKHTTYPDDLAQFTPCTISSVFSAKRTAPVLTFKHDVFVFVTRRRERKSNQHEYKYISERERLIRSIESIDR